jgi:hypothetical protein
MKAHHPPPDTGKSTLQEYLEHDFRQYPTGKLAALGVFLWVSLILLTYSKGGKGVDSILGITTQFLWTLGFALIFGLQLVRHQKERLPSTTPFYLTMSCGITPNYDFMPFPPFWPVLFLPV